MPDTLRTIPDICVQHNLRVGMAQEAMTGLLQTSAQFLRIIHFPIIYNNVIFSSIGQLHRLPAAFRINNGQSGMEQGCIPILVNTAAVRSPSAHGGKHLSDSFLPGFQADHAGNPTHNDHVLSVLHLMYGLFGNVHTTIGDIG